MKALRLFWLRLRFRMAYVRAEKSLSTMNRLLPAIGMSRQQRRHVWHQLWKSYGR